MNKDKLFLLAPCDTFMKDLDLILESRDKTFSFFARRKDVTLFNDAMGIKSYLWLSGYVLPLCKNSSETGSLDQESLIIRLYTQYGSGFTDHIKGIFTIVLANRDRFQVINDKLGIGKFFYSADLRYVSSSYWLLSARFIEGQVSESALLFYLLSNNFPPGHTLTANLRFSEGATRITHAETGLVEEKYWHFSKLLNNGSTGLSIDEISERFRDILLRDTGELHPHMIYLTLTGGLDSRLILAVCKSAGSQPYTFTYGDPESKDVTGARALAQAMGLEHITWEHAPGKDWFETLTGRILNSGNSLINPHRAHRVQAFSDLDVKDPESMLLGGYLGGEILRNFNCDRLSCTQVIDYCLEHRGFLNSPDAFFKLYLKHNREHAFIRKEVLVRNLEMFRESELFHSDPRTNRLCYTFKILISQYYAQDIVLSFEFFKYPIPFFIDQDILEVLFLSGNNFYDKHFSGYNFLKRIGSHRFYAEVINRLSPELSSIPLEKRGYFTPAESIRDPALLLAIKRLFRMWKKTDQVRRPNFSLGPWMREYTGQHLERAVELLGPFINAGKVMDSFKRETHLTTEEYWRRYTNLIYLADIMSSHRNNSYVQEP